MNSPKQNDVKSLFSIKIIIINWKPMTHKYANGKNWKKECLKVIGFPESRNKE